jgi:alkylhydroperoxidase family enzyme
VSWLAAAANTTPDLDGVFGLLPDAYERFRTLYDSLWSDAGLDASLLEMCRLRIGMLLRCDGKSVDNRHVHTALPAEKLAALPLYAASPLFQPHERACIEFAEQYVLDPHGLTDGDFTRLREHFDDKQIATLTLAAAVFDATTRFQLALAVDADGAGTK